MDAELCSSSTIWAFPDPEADPGMLSSLPSSYDSYPSSDWGEVWDDKESGGEATLSGSTPGTICFMFCLVVRDLSHH